MNRYTLVMAVAFMLLSNGGYAFDGKFPSENMGKSHIYVGEYSAEESDKFGKPLKNPLIGSVTILNSEKKKFELKLDNIRFDDDSIIPPFGFYGTSGPSDSVLEFVSLERVKHSASYDGYSFSDSRRHSITVKLTRGGQLLLVVTRVKGFHLKSVSLFTLNGEVTAYPNPIGFTENNRYFVLSRLGN